MFDHLKAILCRGLKERLKGNTHDFSLAAQVCIPTINVVLVEIKNQSYHGRCFLNIDNVANLKV
jgi:hypothetical protein